MGCDLAIHMGVHDHLIVEPVDAVVQHGPVGADLDAGHSAEDAEERQRGRLVVIAVRRVCGVLREEAAGCVVAERILTVGHIAAASGVAIERVNTVGRVVVASCVVKQGMITSGRVEAAGSVVQERRFTVRCVDAARRVFGPRRFGAWRGAAGAQ